MLKNEITCCPCGIRVELSEWAWHDVTPEKPGKWVSPV